MTTTLAGDETMKRIQYFDEWPSPYLYEVHGKVGSFQDYVDYIVYSGLGLTGKHPQGIYAASQQPLPYIFTERMYPGGYLYARVNVASP